MNFQLSLLAHSSGSEAHGPSGPKARYGLAFGMFLALCLPQGGGAQGIVMPELIVTANDATVLARADSLFDAWETEAAWELLSARIDRLPMDYEARWRAARVGLILGILEKDKILEVEWFELAAANGAAAAEIRPRGIDGLYWAAASRGRQALQHGPRTSTELAQQMWDLTERVLALDPEHGGGHNILGKLNFEVQTLGRIQRALARLVLRQPFLSETSWEKALYHHRRAVAAEPDVILFQMDLGQALHRSGNSDEARGVLQRALLLPEVWPVDLEFKEQIRAYLEDEIG